MKDRINELSAKKHRLVGDLVIPARAAANQMKDAGMIEGAAPLLAILFQIEAIDQEMKDLFIADPKGAIDALISMMGGDKE